MKNIDNTIPTKEENPEGLHQKYILNKVDGSEVDEDAEYFILRLDKGGEENHVQACLKAIETYSQAIEQHIPELAADLKRRYNV